MILDVSLTDRPVDVSELQPLREFRPQEHKMIKLCATMCHCILQELQIFFQNFRTVYISGKIDVKTFLPLLVDHYRIGEMRGKTKHLSTSNEVGSS